MPDSPAERFFLVSEALPSDTFHVARFHGTEGLNRLSDFTIEAVCLDPALDAARILAYPLHFRILGRDGRETCIHGFPTRFEQGRQFNGYTWYTVGLRPAFWKLTQMVQSAIFLEKTAEQVVDELLNAGEFFRFPHEFRLTKGGYPTQEFAMQYGETFYDYILWRMEEQGIYYYFAPDADRIIFADSPESQDAATLHVRYAPVSGLEEEHTPHIDSFTLIQTPLPRRVVVRSYDWKNPGKVICGTADVAPDGMGDVYLADENVESDSEAARIAAIRAEERICRSRIFSGTGSQPMLRPGVTFILDDHYNPAMCRDYMVTEVTHEGRQESFLSLGLGIPLEESSKHLFYRSTFTCIEADRQYRPARTAPRARISGCIRAFVDGSGSGARAEMDGYGRYKLLFPFDVSGRRAGNASCWIRMSQQQVGKDLGTTFPLLPGTEVTVAFLDGNPDRPLITGALPNGETGSISGEGNVNFAGIRTPGGNQLTFNDTDNKQGISLLTASGLGLTLGDGSPNNTMWTADNVLSAAGLCSNDLTGMVKNMYSGYKTVTAAAKNRTWFNFLPTVVSGVSSAVTSVFKSLSTSAANAGEDSLANGFSWGTDITSLLTSVLSSGLGIYGAVKKPAVFYNAALTGTQNLASSTLQVSPDKKKLIGYIGTWLGLRAINLGLTEAKGIVNAVDAHNDEKKGEEAYDKVADKRESVKTVYTDAEAEYKKADAAYETAKTVYDYTSDTSKTIDSLYTQISQDYTNAQADYEAAVKKYNESGKTAEDKKALDKAVEKYLRVKAAYDAVSTLHADPSLSGKSIKDIYDADKETKEEKENAYNNIKVLYDHAGDKNESVAKAYEDSKDYFSLQKQATIRTCAIQQLSSLITDITALVTMLIGMAPKDSELGGVTVASTDRNVNINAGKTVSIHGNHGIFLNTVGADKSGKWGISIPAGNKYQIGKTQKSSGQSFIASYTSERFSEATSNTETYDYTTTTAKIIQLQHENQETGLVIGNSSIGLYSPRLISIMIRGTDSATSTFYLNKKGIALEAEKGDVSVSVNGESKNVALTAKGSVIGLSKDGIAMGYNERSSSLDIEKDITLKPHSGKVYVGDIQINGSDINSLKGGIINLGDVVKIMGSQVPPGKGLSSQSDTFKKSVVEVNNEADNEEQQRKKEESDVQSQVKAAGQEDSARVKNNDLKQKIENDA